MRYEIKGETLPVVICQLEEGETMITEGGGMAWMSPEYGYGNINKRRTWKGFWKNVLGDTFSEPLYGEGGPGMISFASCFPGSIKAFDITPGHEMIVQKSAFWPRSIRWSFLCIFRKTQFRLLEGRGLSCRSSAEPGLYLRNSTDMWVSRN